MDDLLAEFLAETLENAEDVRRSAASGRSQGEVAAAVFRMTASIAASARFLDISRLYDVAVAAETVALAVREGRLKGDARTDRLLLAAVGQVAAIAEEMRGGAEADQRADGRLICELQAAGLTGCAPAQVNSFDSSSPAESAQVVKTESPPRLRVIEGGRMEGVRDETLPDC